MAIRKTCRSCKCFAVNPYNPKVGACMDSAHDGVYEQVEADSSRCAGQTNSEQELFDTKNYCPGCNQWLTVGEFKRDKSRINGLSKYCWCCHNKRVDNAV